MKSRILTLLAAMMLFATLAVPIRLVAQEQQQALPRDTVTDLGTLGGTSSLAGGLSNSGWVEGRSTLPGDTGSSLIRAQTIYHPEKLTPQDYDFTTVDSPGLYQEVDTGWFVTWVNNSGLELVSNTDDLDSPLSLMADFKPSSATGGT